jgi:hypothetical protein
MNFDVGQGMDKERMTLRNYVMVFGFMLLAVAMSWAGVVERSSSKYVDDALTQAFSAYAVARGINAVVSVLQSVSVGGSLGASFNVSPGEALDPINDLVERYATVMEFSIGSLLTQKILIGITSSQIFNVLLTLAVAAFILSVIAKTQALTGVLFRTALSLVFLRFAIVLAVLANGWVDAAFLRDGVNQHVAQMDEVSEGVAARIPAPSQVQEPAEGEQGLMDSFKSGVSGFAEKAKGLMTQLDVGAAKEALDQSVPGMVDLMAVLILKTLLLPLLFLYGLKRVFSQLWGWRTAPLKPLAA